jgi:hypothetical protein
MFSLNFGKGFNSYRNSINTEYLIQNQHWKGRKEREEKRKEKEGGKEPRSSHEMTNVGKKG